MFLDYFFHQEKAKNLKKSEAVLTAEQFIKDQSAKNQEAQDEIAVAAEKLKLLFEEKEKDYEIPEFVKKRA